MPFYKLKRKEEEKNMKIYVIYLKKLFSKTLVED